MAEPQIVDVTDDACAAPAPRAVPRCCQEHRDWPTLAQHLVDDFPDVGIQDVVRELRRAKQAADGVALPPAEALEVGELIARQQLMLLTGRLDDIARLDPERHVRH